MRLQKNQRLNGVDSSNSGTDNSENTVQMEKQMRVFFLEFGSVPLILKSARKLTFFILIVGFPLLLPSTKS